MPTELSELVLSKISEGLQFVIVFFHRPPEAVYGEGDEHSVRKGFSHGLLVTETGSFEAHSHSDQYTETAFAFLIP